MSQNHKIMTLTSKTISFLKLGTLLLAALVPVFTFAQTSLTLSVSPTLFEMTANPGQEWTSTVRVINGNPYNLNIYVDVVNFQAQGESGQAKFLPVFTEETGGQTLAEWFRMETLEVTVPAEQTIEVPFKIQVPDDAPPGGHYAAILIGTKSLETSAGQTAVETSQVVTSLVFLRVTGEIIEDGIIREFRSVKKLAERPEMDFELRFQNRGNVHILPQGEIKILNMWGKERGIIPVNRQTMFGNVLPDSVRNYTFSWTGEWSLADIGRYKAIATLAYGEDGRQFASEQATFWVLPWKIVGSVLLLVIGFIMLLTWSIKLYVRKMLSMAGLPVNSSESVSHQVEHRVVNVQKKKKISVVAPLQEGALDLRQRFRDSVTWSDKFRGVTSFIALYKIFFIVKLTIIVFAMIVTWYMKAAAVPERPYEVIIQGPGEEVQISSEQIEYEARKEIESIVAEEGVLESFPSIRIINQSGVSGLAADLRLQLEAKGYPIIELRNDFEQVEKNTVIVYAPEFAQEALVLSADVFGALLSAFDGASGTDTPITIYVGKDLQNAVQ